MGVSFGADDAFIEGQLLAAGNASGTGKSRPRMGEFSGHATDARDSDEGVGGGRKAGGGSARPQPRCEPECLYAVAGRKPSGDCEPVGEKPPGDVNGVQTVFRMKLGFVSR